MHIQDYRTFLTHLAKETFTTPSQSCTGYRSKRSRELNKAAIRLNDAQLEEFRTRVEGLGGPMKTPAYTMRDIILGIQQRTEEGKIQ